MKQIVNINAYFRTVQTMWEKRGWRLVPEDDFMPRTDGKGLIYYQRRMFDPVWVNENPRNWPLAVYALEHEANHNQENQKACFKYMRDHKINMAVFENACANLLWDEMNDRLGFQGPWSLMGRVVFCEDRWPTAMSVTKHKRMSIMHTIFAWDCINRANWNELLLPFARRVIERPSEQESKWLETLVRRDYYDKLVDLSTSHPSERGEALWTLTRDILREVFDYEEESTPGQPEGGSGAPGQPEEGKGGEGEDASDSSEGDPGGENADGDVNSERTSASEGENKKSEENQKDVVVDYEELLVSRHVSDANVKKMSPTESAKFKIDYSKYAGRRYYRYYQPDEFTVVDFETGETNYGRRAPRS